MDYSHFDCHCSGVAAIITLQQDNEQSSQAQAMAQAKASIQSIV